LRREEDIKTSELPEEVKAVSEMAMAMTITAKEAARNIRENGRDIVKAYQGLSDTLQKSAQVLIQALNTERENNIEQKEDKPLEIWLNSDCEMIDEHCVFDYYPGLIPSEHYYHEDAYLELKGKYNKLIKGVELMIARCGLENPGDACRAVIKTGEELFKDVGHAY
jgi:hypothetical protein